MAINPDLEPIAAFRPMVFDDVPRIMEIEVASYDHPWTSGIFRDCIRVGYNCWLYEIENQIQAYGLISIAANEAHILNICVAREYRGQGVGRKMLNKLLQVAEAKQVDSIFLEVRESNTAAIQLYDREGFNRLGIRKGYYPGKDGRENALVFAKALNLPDEQENT